MQLGEWLIQSKLSASELAKRLGVAESTINRLIPRDGKKQVRRPGWALMALIKDATAGAVSADDWLVAFEETAEVNSAPGNVDA